MNVEVSSVYDAEAGLIEALVHECGQEYAQARLVAARIKDLIEAVVFENSPTL